MTILHGDDEIAIHKELSRILRQASQSGIQVTRIEAKGLLRSHLESVLGTQDLFSSEKIVIVERLHTLPKSKMKDELIEMIAKCDPQTDIVLVENKILTPTMLKKFSTSKVLLFKVPMILFSFLDSLGMQPTARLITSFHQVIETQDAEFVFAMIIRQIRTLISFVSDGSYSGSPFGRNKIVSQSSRFSLDTLLNLHAELVNIDTGQKTSRSSLSIAQEIDLWLARL